MKKDAPNIVPRQTQTRPGYISCRLSVAKSKWVRDFLEEGSGEVAKTTFHMLCFDQGIAPSCLRSGIQLPDTIPCHAGWSASDNAPGSTKSSPAHPSIERIMRRARSPSITRTPCCGSGLCNWYRIRGTSARPCPFPLRQPTVIKSDAAASSRLPSAESARPGRTKSQKLSEGVIRDKLKHV